MGGKIVDNATTQTPIFCIVGYVRKTQEHNSLYKPTRIRYIRFYHSCAYLLTSDHQKQLWGILSRFRKRVKIRFSYSKQKYHQVCDKSSGLIRALERNSRKPKFFIEKHVFRNFGEPPKDVFRKFGTSQTGKKRF